MAPTLSIFHRSDNSEQLAFRCEHAATTADHLGGNGDTLRAAMQHVIARHGAACRCAPAVTEEFYESLAYMRAEMERDLAAATDPAIDPRVLVIARARLDSLGQSDCPCDPHVVVTLSPGLSRFDAYHRSGCTRPVRKGQACRTLDFSPAVPA